MPYITFSDDPTDIKDMKKIDVYHDPDSQDVIFYDGDSPEIVGGQWVPYGTNIVYLEDSDPYPYSAVSVDDIVVTSDVTTVLSDDIVVTDEIHLEGATFLNIKCSDNQFLTADRQGEIICKDLPKRQLIMYETMPREYNTIIYKEAPMWTISNILIVALIAAVVYKIIPKITIYKVFKALWRLVLHPFSRKADEVKREWEDAKEKGR